MRRAARCHDRGDRGAVTAEAALVLPLLVALTIGLVWLLSLAAAQVRVVDAARETARAASRGDSEAVAVQRGLTAAPGATIRIVEQGDEIRVSVVAHLGGPGGLFDRLPGADLEAEAIAVRESG